MRRGLTERGRGTAESIRISMEAGRMLFHAPVRHGAGNRRRMRRALIACGIALAALMVAGAALGPLATAADLAARNLAPSLAHIFGTDQLGRDMLARTLAGLSTSLFVGLVASLASSCIAVLLACVAAFGGRRGDAVVSWLTDLTMGVPHLVLLILISYALGRGFWGVTVGIALTHWPSLTRVLRAELLQLISQPYLAQSEALGVSRLRMALTHLLPAVLPQLIIGAVLTAPHAILHEASITFLGFGLSPEEPAIGVILAEAFTYLSAGSWWLAVLPGAVLVACMLLLERVGDLCRRLLDAHTVQE